jgi:arylformamidase
LRARVEIDEREITVDLAAPISLAVEVSFGEGAQAWFGAPPARALPLLVGTFRAAVAAGAGCNCSTLTLTPHCHGTHTESAGHLTLERLDAYRIIPAGLLSALVVSVRPELAEHSEEGTDPPPHPGDRLITRAQLESNWSCATRPRARALVLRTQSIASQAKVAGAHLPPYFSREAMSFLIEQGIEHLIVDLPSLDRLSDEGRLSAHRLFFGLPAGTSALSTAGRAHCTVTELAHVPEAIRDGPYLLELQAPALAGDAVPSRPLLYAIAAP